MNVVWPITALYFSIFGLWGYFRAGRKMTKSAGGSEHDHKQMTPQARSAPTFTDMTWVQFYPLLRDKDPTK